MIYMPSHQPLEKARPSLPSEFPALNQLDVKANTLEHLSSLDSLYSQVDVPSHFPSYDLHRLDLQRFGIRF